MSLKIYLLGQFNHPFTLADILSWAGCLYHKMKRDPHTQLDCANELEQMLTSREGGAWNDVFISFHGDALAMLGHLDEGIELLKEGVTCNEMSKTNINLTVYLCSLADAYARNGQIKESWTVLDKALKQAEKSGEYFWLPELHRVKAKLLRMEGKDGAAESSLHVAINTARDQGANSWELRAAIDLAAVKEQGDEEAMRAVLKPAYVWFPETADSLDLREARALLAAS
jgi:predicted ATPase